MLYELIYTSVASREMSSEDLAHIQKIASLNNEKLNITGMLMYHNRTFIQLLEGDKDFVLELYKKIKKDDRHTRVEIFWQSEIERKNFANWSMALAHLEDAQNFDPDILSNFIQKGFTNEMLIENPSIGQELLLSLRPSL